MFDHFGLLAPFYDRIIRLRQPDKLISLVGLPVSGALLDAGGGTGRVAQAFRGLASQLVVADYSIGMLKQASEKNGLYTVCSITENLPFPDEYFERVIMVDALHHVENQLATTKELWRVLKRGGRLVIEEPDINTVIIKLVAIAEKLALMRSHFLSPKEIQAMFNFLNARAELESEGFNALVIIEKN